MCTVGVQDTLLRCAKLEVRKRALEAREQQLDEAYQQRMTSKYDAVEDATEEEGDDGVEDDEDEEDEEDDEEDVSLAIVLSAIKSTLSQACRRC
jgi:type II secretory ATPase GspE/PulE/Tfp pilus assembly ATPase PilB-like protein